MDCTVCVQYGALCMPSKKITARVSRLGSSFNFSPSSLALSSGGSKHRTPLRHALSPVISAQPMPSNSNVDKKFVAKGIGGASTVTLACVLGLMSCNPRALAAPRWYSPPLTQSQSQSQSHRVGRSSSERQDKSLHQMSAKEVLRSLLMVNEHVASSSKSKKLNPRPPAELSIKDCEDLKMMAAEMIKDGKGDKAEKQLTDLYDAMRKAQKWESAYQVQMALVAILIFQGKYQQAAKCDCLKEPAKPSDGRVHLYKAIIHTMLDRNKEAKESWEGFVTIL